MAERINEYLTALGFKDLGVKERPNLIVLNSTNMPAILVEAGFIHSDIDNEIFDEVFDEVAQAIADGVSDMINANTTAQETSADAPVYHIQTGLFRNREYAENLQNELLNEGFPVFLTNQGEFYRVETGAYTSLQNAVQMERNLRMFGYSTIIITE